MNHLLTDNFGRNHNYLRISLTDNCNLRCFYCMPNEDYDFTPASKLMQVDEIEAIAKLFVSFGVNKIRLTGGEPLVRKDAHKIIEEAMLLANVTTAHFLEKSKLGVIFYEMLTGTTPWTGRT